MDTGKVNPNAPAQRWVLSANGGISWDVANETVLPHYDHIEMAGFGAAGLISYGVTKERELMLHRRLIVPQLRTLPDDTHASFAHNLTETVRPHILVENAPISHYLVQEVSIYGNLQFYCVTNTPLEVTRTIYPASTKRGLIEEWVLTNKTDSNLNVQVKDAGYLFDSNPARGLTGSYRVLSRSVYKDQSISSREYTTINIAAKTSQKLYFVLYADEKAIAKNNILFDPREEIEKRIQLRNDLFSKLVLKTPDEIINREFQFAKLRASESIFTTENGLMHGPGGASYYAAVWTNDQCEYANPFFAFTGYDKAIEQSINSYHLYKKYMKPNYEVLVSSIISEGRSFWQRASRPDRGDAAMYAYGASRFALTNGDKEVAKGLWPMIQWCLEFSKRKTNTNGVIDSDTDELEGRFPTGTANLCTSSLHYDALISSSYLAREFGEEAAAIAYEAEAKKLRDNIENFFGANMKGFETYRYYEENKTLRSWIAIPLTMGIYDRAEGTIEALYSDKLWFGNGMLTEEGHKTFWDRSTLYAFRGTLAAGEVEKTMTYLQDYTQRRLLGEHVPYPVEAWPEGNQKHLSAESALYCRIFTEGLLGIRPTGLSSFNLTPRLPANWDFTELQQIHAFGSVFTIKVNRENATDLTVSLQSPLGETFFSETKPMGSTYAISL